MDKYALRPLEEGDLTIVLEWRNSPRIHDQMLTDHKISWEEHEAWFRRIKDIKPSRNLIFMYEEIAVGYVGYTEFDEEKRCCSPGAYLGKSAGLPLDAGINLFFMCLDYAFSQLGMVRVETSVFADNYKALQMDEFLGYKRLVGREEYLEKNGQRRLAYRYAITRDEWVAKRPEFLFMLE